MCVLDRRPALTGRISQVYILNRRPALTGHASYRVSEFEKVLELRKVSPASLFPSLDRGNYSRDSKNGGPCRKLGSGSAQEPQVYSPTGQVEVATAQAQGRKWKLLMLRFRRRTPCSRYSRLHHSFSDRPAFESRSAIYSTRPTPSRAYTFDMPPKIRHARTIFSI